MDIPPEQLEICLNVLQQISDEPRLIEQHDRLKNLIAKIYQKNRKISRRAKRAEDRKLKETTVMLQTQRQQQSVILSPDSGENSKYLNQSIRCYICKRNYTQIHFFYHLLCPDCAEHNYQKRSQRTNLTGRVALVTGGRIKIGYQVVLRLLRDGARVIVTTRFPYDCAHHFSLEADFEQWRDRLQIHGLDLRNIPAVEAFVHHLRQTEPALDILINNAAQTIKRPLAFYQHLLDQEQNVLERLSVEAQALLSGNHHPTPLLETQTDHPQDLPALVNPYFPLHTFDADGQQLDLRPINSWLLKLDQVSPIELVEVQLVNAIAPFILNSQLKPLLMRSRSVSEGHSPFERRFIINVSAMEGQFNRDSKTAYHPHTNMAKAALNMMTRTSASDYAQDNIFMNSVDTGWITDENPYPKKTSIQTEQGFYTPLDIIDGMARIYDPIVQGIENPDTPMFGYFLKDYLPYPW
jgi:NAD(P)-dependent dehydrogenase (short-subunit alcohol dehydrogenase family)